MSESKSKILLGLILVFGLAVRLYFYGGLFTPDAYDYAQLSSNIANGDTNIFKKDFAEYGYYPQEQTVFAMRYGITLPMALIYYLFGVGPLTSIAWFLIASLGTIIVVYYLGRLLCSNGVGLLGALLYSFLPHDIFYSTTPLPPSILNFFLALSAYFTFIAFRRDENNSLHYFLGGLFIGLAYFTSSLAMIYLVFPFAMAIAKRRFFHWKYLYAILGMTMFLMVEAVFNYFMVGDALYRFHCTFLFYSYGVKYGSQMNYWYYPLNFFHTNLYGYFSYLFVVAFIGGLFDIKKNWEPYIWLLSVFLYLEFGIQGFDPLTLIHKSLRYLSLINAPLVIICASFLYRWHKFKPLARLFKERTVRNVPLAPLLTSFVIMILFIQSVRCIRSENKYYERVENTFREFCRFIYDLPEQDIYSHFYYWPIRLSYQYRYQTGYNTMGQSPQREKRLKRLKGLISKEIPPDSYVILDHRFFKDSVVIGQKKLLAKDFPVYTAPIPDSWKLLKSAKDIQLYQVVL